MASSFFNRSGKTFPKIASYPTPFRYPGYREGTKTSDGTGSLLRVFSSTKKEWGYMHNPGSEVAQPLHYPQEVQDGNMAYHHNHPGPGDFLTSIDLSEAYLHIPIHPSRMKFIRFSYGHHHYQYRALPFGLSSAPRVFTKILVAPVAKLRSQGVCVFPYLDDLVAASSFSQASEDLQRVMTSFTQHGFVINKSKVPFFHHRS